MIVHSFRKNLHSKVFIVLSMTVGLLLSCTPGIDPTVPTDPTTPSSGTKLSFNVSGAKAIAASTSSSSASSSYNSARAVSSLDDLVKINEDGTVESAISFGSETSWKPTVSFISIGSDKSVYICFKEIYRSYSDSAETTTGNTETTTGSSETPTIGTCTSYQFLRVYPDNHFDVLWPLDPTNYNEQTDGQVCTWTWEGMDSDPLQKGDDGQLYFKVQSGAYGFVYSYDPSAGGKPALRTPTNGKLYIESFKVDSQKHLFINGGDVSSDFLRYYSQGVTAPVNIFYSSDSTPWVRGYTSNLSGNALILNGNDINGMSGIIRANLQTTGSPTYDLLYSSGANMGNISLAQDSNNNSYSNPTAIVDCNSTACTYTWDSSVLTSGSLDMVKLLAKVAILYYDVPTITDTQIASFQSADLNAYATYKTRDAGASSGTSRTITLGYLIHTESAGFLREYFGGTLMTDKVAGLGLSNFDISNVSNLFWGQDGSLYGIYSPSYYSSSTTDTAYVVKLLDSSGNKALNIVSLRNGKCKPSIIKISGGYLYYRYSVMNGTVETGYHKLARYNISSGSEEEIFTDSSLSGKNVELLSYDVSSDNSTMYISALDYTSNAVIFGKINLATKQFTQLPADASYGTVRSF